MGNRSRRLETARRRRAERAGRLAEWLVASGYRLLGWRLLARRLRTPYGELDLVLRKGRTVLFVEVKRRGPTAAAAVAHEVLSSRQRARLARAASYHLAKTGLLDAPVRFDVVVWEGRRLPRRLENVIWEE